jgi:hypothetical protein
VDEIKILARIINGRVDDFSRDRIVSALACCKEGDRLLITLKNPGKRRSSLQNAYYWGVVVAIIREWFVAHGTAVDAQDVHEYLKQRVGKLSKVIITPDGDTRVITGSTAEMNTQEFSGYVENIIAWAAGNGINIPAPGEWLD